MWRLGRVSTVNRMTAPGQTSRSPHPGLRQASAAHEPRSGPGAVRTLRMRTRHPAARQPAVRGCRQPLHDTLDRGLRFDISMIMEISTLVKTRAKLSASALHEFNVDPISSACNNGALCRAWICAL